MTEVDFTDPWEKERQEKHRKVMRWVLGERPQPRYVLTLGLPGLLLIAGARIGVSLAGGEPTWFDIPRIIPLGGALIVAACIEGLRCWGHEGLKYIRWVREASEVRD